MTEPTENRLEETAAEETAENSVEETTTSDDSQSGGIGLNLADAIAQAKAEEETKSVPQIDLAAAIQEEAAKEAPAVEPEAVVEKAPVEAAPAEAEEEPEVDEGPQLIESDLPWYVVNTYSGYEINAKKTLEERARSNNLTHRFGNILVPQETVVELVRGQKKTSTRKFFPGYMLIQVDLDEETWHLVNDTPKVTGFVGDPRNPSPLSPSEVEGLVQQMETGASRPRPRVEFEEGDSIKVIDGPFTDFNGTVDEVKADKGKLRVLISIFGRNTPVELDFVQVEKA